MQATATGKLIATRTPRQRESLVFPRLTGNEVPEELDLHLTLDSQATDKHAMVKRRLAVRPRYICTTR